MVCGGASQKGCALCLGLHLPAAAARDNFPGPQAADLAADGTVIVQFPGRPADAQAVLFRQAQTLDAKPGCRARLPGESPLGHEALGAIPGGNQQQPKGLQRGALRIVFRDPRPG